MAALIRLGKTDIHISTVGLGCWQFSQAKGLVGSYWAHLTQEEVTQIVAVSIKKGVNWFDTAEAYGSGSSERALAEGLRFLQISSEDIYIATKWWPTPRFASSIPASARRSQNNLGEYPISIYQVHNPFSLSPKSEQMREMAKLVKAGIIKHVGVSNFNALQMRQAADVLYAEGLRMVSNQVRYSLLDRSIESNGVLEAAEELDISIIAYSPLAQGILTGRFHAEPSLIKARGGFRRFLPDFRKAALDRSRALVHVLRRIGASHQAVPAQIALAWLIQRNPGRVAVIPGASSAAQAEKNAVAMDITLTTDEILEIDLISKTVG